MTRCEEMIIALFPSARPGIDFEFSKDDDGKIYLSRWDEVTLGKMPDLRMLRDHFMAYLERKRRTIPTIDMTDPCPWLDEVPPMEDIAVAPASIVPESCPKKVLIIR